MNTTRQSNITVVDTKHELKVLVVVDASFLHNDLEMALKHFRITGEGTPALMIHANGNTLPIKGSREIGNIYTELDYRESGAAVIRIRACYKEVQGE